jgi:hypothetical protein
MGEPVSICRLVIDTVEARERTAGSPAELRAMILDE